MGKPTKELISNGDILVCLRNHLMEQRPVTLFNTFHGVPVRSEADVAMVSADALGLIVHPYQAVCIKFERRTFIESKALARLIRAYPASIDYTNQVVMLKKLKAPESINVDLDHSWVTPENPIPVVLQTKDNASYETNMQEIAVLKENHVRVVMTVPVDSPYVRGEKLTVGFRFEPEVETIWVQGKVHSLIKIRNQAVKRLEIDGRVSMTDEVTILAYIAKREDQILNTLDKTYKKLRKGKLPSKVV